MGNVIAGLSVATVGLRTSGGPELILGSSNDEPFGGEDANGIESSFDMVFCLLPEFENN